MLLFKARIGAELRADKGSTSTTFNLVDSVDHSKSRIRLDDLAYSYENPDLVDKFDYLVFNDCTPSSGLLERRISDVGSDSEGDENFGSSMSTHSCSESAINHRSMTSVMQFDVGRREDLTGGYEDRFGHYTRLGLLSYIPRRVLTKGIYEVLYELSKSMERFLEAVDERYVLDLTNCIFVVKSMEELLHIDTALARYGLWIMQTQLDHGDGLIPFANDSIEYLILSRSDDVIDATTLPLSDNTINDKVVNFAAGSPRSFSFQDDDDEDDNDSVDDYYNDDTYGIDDHLSSWLEYLTASKTTNANYMLAVKHLLFS